MNFKEKMKFQGNCKDVAFFLWVISILFPLGNKFPFLYHDYSSGKN